MKKFKGSLMLIVLCLTFSCMTVNLKELSISKINVLLKDAENIPVTRLLPESVYKLEISVEDREGKIYTRFNLNDLQIRPYHSGMLDIEKNLFGVYLHTSRQMAPFLNGNGYRISIDVLENEYKTQIFNWDVDWNNIAGFDYSGSSGGDGQDGRSGRDNNGISSFDLDGGDGEDGDHGYDGQSGPSLSLYAFYYDMTNSFLPGYNERKILMLYSPETENLNLVKFGKHIYFYGRGGMGGSGGDGGDSGEAGTYTESRGVLDPFSNSSPSLPAITKTGDPGVPGRGGDGGNGGDGGRIKLIYCDDNIIEKLHFDVSGGKGGPAGIDGDAPVGAFNHPKGIPGFSGRDGKEGEIVYNKISLEELKTVIKKMNIGSIDIEKIISIQ